MHNEINILEENALEPTTLELFNWIDNIIALNTSVSSDTPLIEN